ncbi:hypothetical protein A3Q56_06871 [Intoshia linei]|uniref:Uncharacterized protein n=1 Tax=Intoshia linei TaxID=1819745 RepID=A0A177AW38_9BILA|nr:hypothetical protein A3Q56_06871 [Intoshia linei]
MKFPIYRQY